MKEQAKIWEKHIENIQWDSLRKSVDNPAAFQVELKVLIDKYIEEGKRRIIEVGCETGVSSLILSDKFDKTLLDLNPKAIEWSEKLFDVYGKEGHFIVADMFRMPFEDGRFDIVFNAGVIEHFKRKELEKAFKEYGRILAEDGVMIIGFPNQFSWAGPCCSSLFKDSAKFEFETKFEKIILLTKGTHLKWAKNSIIDIARELSQKYPNYLFVVSLGSYLEREKEIIKEKNLQIYHYLDYDEILPKVDYVIHHGGAGILYSCIKHNKPAVIIPHDYDQFDYGVRADLAKIAYVANLKSKKSIMGI